VCLRVTTSPRHPVVASYYLCYLVPCTFDAHGRGTHSPWTSALSPTLRGGACNQVSCLDLWVPRFPTNFKFWRANPLPIGCGSTSLSHVPSPLAYRALYMRFLQSSVSCRHTQERNADQLYRQMPAVKTNLGTPASPLPGAKSLLTPLLHRRHRLHRLTAATH
jgi:hypothetical protein